MMFLIRTSFWLLVLILLLPTDENQQNQIYGTAQTAMNDLKGFCDRNPQTCVTSQEAFEVLVQKAQYGAELVMNLVEAKTGPLQDTLPANRASDPVPMPAADPAPVQNQSPILNDGSVMPVPAAPLESATWDPSASQDTLNPEDKEAAWGGPSI